MGSSRAKGTRHSCLVVWLREELLALSHLPPPSSRASLATRGRENGDVHSHGL